mmetsp:Transcript_39573/g.91363  ORF Transcript_39573/g.91363 Transcript_39573/m.91363 type:complete len:759 (+) Transcript_39573:57-2333(+)
MPKVDRATQLKKKSQQEIKKLSPEEQRELRGGGKKIEIEPEAAQVSETRGTESKVAQRVNGKNGKASQASAFSRAAGHTASVSDDEEEDEPEQPKEEAVARQVKQSAKENGKDRKQKEAARKLDDLQLLAEEQRIAMKQRITQRFLRMTLIGVLLETLPAPASGSDRSQKASSSQKAKKSSNHEVSRRSMKERIDAYGGPFLVLALSFLILFAKLGEETWTPDARANEVENFYETLHVPVDASARDIKKSFQKLSLLWHPDKNPDCKTACADKFPKIMEAYETLKSPDKRKAYDERRASEGTLASAYSVDLTDDDFEARVLRSNEIWIVQVWESAHPQWTEGFHPVWEDVASAAGGYARFGRLDSDRNRKALDLLPHRTPIMPVVWKLGRGLEPELFAPHGRRDEGSSPLLRFVTDGYPSFRSLTTYAEATAWWSLSRPRVLVVAPKMKDQLLAARHAAFQWTNSVDCALIDPQLAKSALKLEVPESSKARMFLAAKGSSGAVVTQGVTSVQDLSVGLRSHFSRLSTEIAPYLTVRNYEQLCTPEGDKRTYCLIMIDSSDSAATKAVIELADSHAAYLQDVHELKKSSEEDGGEEATEELFAVQAVRVSTGTSRLPWLASAARWPAFGAMWQEVGRAPAILLELETRRVAPVKSPTYGNVFQSIAYEEVHFKELPETVSLRASMPDPELPFRRELSKVLGSVPGALISFLILASMVAVLPELPLPNAVACVAGLFAVVLLVWPAACRRFIAVLWPQVL